MCRISISLTIDIEELNIDSFNLERYNKYITISFMTFPANYPLEVVRRLPKDFQTGVYFGWANLDSGEVYKMVMNIGWCPFYNNKEKSMVSKFEFNRHLIRALISMPFHLSFRKLTF